MTGDHPGSPRLQRGKTNPCAAPNCYRATRPGAGGGVVIAYMMSRPEGHVYSIPRRGTLDTRGIHRYSSGPHRQPEKTRMNKRELSLCGSSSVPRPCPRPRPTLP